MKNPPPDIVRIDEEFFGPRRKQSLNSRNKGVRAEQLAAKWLSAWTGLRFSRTPNSGGLHALAQAGISGDMLAPIGSGFPFTVEVKSYQKLYLPVPIKRRLQLHTFFEQASRDAARAKLLPLLLARMNGYRSDQFLFICGIGVASAVASFGIEPFTCGQNLWVFDGRQVYTQAPYVELVARLDTTPLLIP